MFSYAFWRQIFHCLKTAQMLASSAHFGGWGSGEGVCAYLRRVPGQREQPCPTMPGDKVQTAWGEPQGGRQLGCLGKGLSSLSLEVESWRPVFEGFWSQGGVGDCCGRERISFDITQGPFEGGSRRFP